MWDASDEALVAGLAAGDTDPALVFIRRFQRRIFGLVVSIVGEHHAAAEVAQDTFVRDHVKRGSGIGPRDRLSWQCRTSRGDRGLHMRAPDRTVWVGQA